MNTLIEINANDDLRDVTAGPGGVTTKEIRLVIGEGVTKGEAHKALMMLGNAIISDNIQLN
jgi:hypothetical protein